MEDNNNKKDEKVVKKPKKDVKTAKKTAEFKKKYFEFYDDIKTTPRDDW